MGSLGGKVGFAVGLLMVAVFAVPVMHVTPGSCFFEGGCGENESTGLLWAAAILIALAIIGGGLTRALINRLTHRRG